MNHLLCIGLAEYPFLRYSGRYSCVQSYYVDNCVMRVMGRIDIHLPDDIENVLSMEVGRGMGVKRGVLTEAIIQPVDAWLDDETRVKCK